MRVTDALSQGPQPSGLAEKHARTRDCSRVEADLLQKDLAVFLRSPSPRTAKRLLRCRSTGKDQTPGSFLPTTTVIRLPPNCCKNYFAKLSPFVAVHSLCRGFNRVGH